LFFCFSNVFFRFLWYSLKSASWVFARSAEKQFGKNLDRSGFRKSVCCKRLLQAYAVCCKRLLQAYTLISQRLRIYAGFKIYMLQTQALSWIKKQNKKNWNKTKKKTRLHIYINRKKRPKNKCECEATVYDDFIVLLYVFQYTKKIQVISKANENRKKKRIRSSLFHERKKNQSGGRAYVIAIILWINENYIYFSWWKLLFFIFCVWKT